MIPCLPRVPGNTCETWALLCLLKTSLTALKWVHVAPNVKVLRIFGFLWFSTSISSPDLSQSSTCNIWDWCQDPPGNKPQSVQAGQSHRPHTASHTLPSHPCYSQHLMGHKCHRKRRRAVLRGGRESPHGSSVDSVSFENLLRSEHRDPQTPRQ